MSLPSIDDLLRGDDRAADPRFRELVASVIEMAPRNARAEAIMRLANHLWSMFTDAHAIKMAERKRILDIVDACKSRDELMPALEIALTTDHPPDVAAAMIERQRAASIS